MRRQTKMLFIKSRCLFLDLYVSRCVILCQLLRICYFLCLFDVYRPIEKKSSSYHLMKTDKLKITGRHFYAGTTVIGSE